MDPCAFVRVTVDRLLLKLPPHTPLPASAAGVHPSSPLPFFCALRLNGAAATVPLPLASSAVSGEVSAPPALLHDPVVFVLDPATIARQRHPELLISACVGANVPGACGVGARRVIGKLRLPVNVARAAAGELVTAQSGWAHVGGGCKLHAVVRAQLDLRFVLQFGGEPECSPVVYQVLNGGGRRQPLFSCRFSAGRRSRSLADDTNAARTTHSLARWLNSLRGGERDAHHRRDQRKGWTVTIHDLSGSPVAAASMVTPFVPSRAGSARVSQSNPGAWLIFRVCASGPASNFSGPIYKPAGIGTGGPMSNFSGPLDAAAPSWKPCFRLEAWRERGGTVDSVSFRLEKILHGAGLSSRSVAVAETSMSVKKGGEFIVRRGGSPADEVAAAAEFVASASVEGEGRVSRPVVQIGYEKNMYVADLAVYVALAAAVDLSLDACQLFTHKLRKELCHDQQE